MELRQQTLSFKTTTHVFYPLGDEEDDQEMEDDEDKEKVTLKNI